MAWLRRLIGSVLIGLAAARCATPAPPAATLIPTLPPPASATRLALPTLPPSVTPSPVRTATPRPAITASATLTATPAPSVKLMAVGDVMLARSVGIRAVANGVDTPFAGVAPILQSAQVVVANLECAVSRLGEPQPKAYTFEAPPEALDGLRDAGVNVVSLANNHALDYGPLALAEMRRLLLERGIQPAGAGADRAEAHAPVLLTRNGLRLAFLSYVDVPVETRGGFDTRTWIATADQPGVAWAAVADIQADVTAARGRADVVVVLLHSGWEYRTEPAANQIAEAHAAIDAGAALVLGAHPHVLQGVEAYHHGLIVYSLGNFVFDGFDGAANDSAIFSGQLGRDGVEAYAWVPVVIEGGFPRLATDAEAPRILRRLQPLASP